MPHQVAALPYRRSEDPDGALEVLLVTSARSGRWIIPKGNVDGEMPRHLAAAKEAEEEGGVCGRIVEQSIGRYCYHKLHDSGALRQLEVDVYPLEVREELAEWPEMGFRKRQWIPMEEAADVVGEPELAAILRAFSRDCR